MPRNSKQQASLKEFVPMQEIIESIYEMLKRVASLQKNNIEDPEFQTLLSRIRNQAFCMQGILTDERMKKSLQFKNMLNYFHEIQNDGKVNELVKVCINQIIPIFCNQHDINEYMKYSPIHPSSHIISSFYKSQNYIEERHRLAEQNPQEYIRQGRFDIHGVSPGRKPNFSDLYNDQKINANVNDHFRGSYKDDRFSTSSGAYGSHYKK